MIQAVTPSDIFSWQGPTEFLKRSSARIADEQKWYALTGLVVEIRAEEDGDVHIALRDATGDKPGIVVAEIPAKPQKEWCELRKIVFSWTATEFPFRVRSGRKLKMTEPRIITVTGKAFFDINHAPADQSRERLRNCDEFELSCHFDNRYPIRFTFRQQNNFTYFAKR